MRKLSPEVEIRTDMNISERAKCVCIWLRNNEKGDAALRERLKAIYRKYYAHKYNVCVFESGGGDPSRDDW